MNTCVLERGNLVKQESCLVDALMDWLAIPLCRKIVERTLRTLTCSPLGKARPPARSWAQIMR